MAVASTLLLLVMASGLGVSFVFSSAVPPESQRVPSPPWSDPARVETGTTADVVRNEILAGQPSGATFHTIKTQEMVRGAGTLAVQQSYSQLFGSTGRTVPCVASDFARQFLSFSDRIFG